MIVVVMGVSGSGKTTVGRGLADALGWPFHEGDDLHPPANVAKMSRGIPLTDADRQPWLEAVRRLLDEHLERGQPAVVTCSALKQAYRDFLAAGRDGVVFVYLKVPAELLRERLEKRQDHYMPAGLLASQLDTLEEPREAITIDAAADPDAAIRQVIDHLPNGRKRAIDPKQ